MSEEAIAHRDELITILQELHALAGAAALVKFLEPCECSSGADWHVISVQPCHWIQINEEMAWHVQVQYRHTAQTHYEYITATEIFAYRLKIAMAYDNEREMTLQESSREEPGWII